MIAIGDVAVMPEQDQFATMLLYFVNDLLADVVGFLLILYIHIVATAKGAIHDA